MEVEINKMASADFEKFISNASDSKGVCIRRESGLWIIETKFFNFGDIRDISRFEYLLWNLNDTFKAKEKFAIDVAILHKGGIHKEERANHYIEQCGWRDGQIEQFKKEAEERGLLNQ